MWKGVIDGEDWRWGLDFACGGTQDGGERGPTGKFGGFWIVLSSNHVYLPDLDVLPE